MLDTYILLKSNDIMKLFGFDFIECYDDDDYDFDGEWKRHAEDSAIIHGI